MHEKKRKNCSASKLEIRILETMKQIIPTNKIKDSKKWISFTHAQNVVKKGMSNWEEGKIREML